MTWRTNLKMTNQNRIFLLWTNLIKKDNSNPEKTAFARYKQSIALKLNKLQELYKPEYP